MLKVDIKKKANYTAKVKVVRESPCRVKIGGRRVQIFVGSPTGRVEAVPVQIIFIVLHV